MFGYDGSIRIKADLNHSAFDRGLTTMTGSVQKFGNTLMKLAGIVGLAFGTAAIINFGKESVKAASELSDAWMGLQSIVEGQGRSFSRAKAFVEDYVSDGLVPLTDAVTAYKNLAARGYNDEQIQKTMTALKDAAAFGRQSTYTLGEAVATATEGLKNENSILVDNAGVTKNVAKMWEDYAKSIGTTSNNLTTEQKIQAEVNGILEETRFQTGDAAKLVNTYSGQIAMLGYNFQQLKVQVGNALIPIVQAVLPGINAIISALVKLAKVFAQVTALLFGKPNPGSAGQVSTQEEIASSGLAAADATDKLADSTAGAGSAAKKAAKDMKGVLAGFDELNILADSASGSLSGAAGGLDLSDTAVEIPEVELEGDLFEDVQISPKLLAEVEAFKDAIGRIWEVFKQSWEENGPEVLEAGKRALTSLYELAKSIGSAFTEAWTGGAGLEFLNAVFALLKTVLNIIADIADAWKTAFDNVGTEFFESILFRLTSWLELLNSIGEAFREVWNNGTGVEICETILRILTDINDIFGTLYTKIREAWEANGNGVAIWQAILDIVQTVLSYYERLTSATLEWAESLNLEPLISSFRRLLEAINPLVEVITGDLAWAYENVLLPFGKWFLEELSPAAVEALTAAVRLLTEVLKAFQPLGSWLWDSFLRPLADWTGELVIGALRTITDIFNGLSTWISEHQGELEQFFEPFGTVLETISEALQKVGEKISAVYEESIRPFIDSVIESFGEWFATVREGWETHIKPVLDGIAERFDEVVMEHVVPMIEKAVEFIGKVMEVVKLLWDNVLSPIVTWIIQDAFPKIADKLEDLGDSFNTWLMVVSDVLDGVFEVLNGLLDFVLGVFTGDWERAWEGIKEIFKGIWNTIIGLLEGAANYIVDGINSIISQANKLSFQVPDIFGGGRIGINIPKISAIELPRLANGAVIPPNQQFAAILGDQRSGTNIEAPLATIEQALQNVMNRNMSSGYTGDTTVILQVNETELGRVVYRLNNKETQRVGVRLTEVRT